MKYFLIGVMRGLLLAAFGFALFGTFSYYLYSKQWVPEAVTLAFATSTIWLLLTLPISWTWVSPQAQKKHKARPLCMNSETKFWIREMAERHAFISEVINDLQRGITKFTTAPTKDVKKYKNWRGVRYGLLNEKMWLEVYRGWAWKDGKKYPVTVQNYYEHFPEDLVRTSES